MSRRADPARVDVAGGDLEPPHLEDVDDATADASIAWWAVQAAREGIERGGADCERCWDWINAQRERRAKP